MIRVDACPQGIGGCCLSSGIGGYCLSSGIAWRYQLPEDLLGQASLNALEFLAAYIGAKVELNYGPRWTPDDAMLSQGDSTSASGWVNKSSFNDACPIHLAITRAFALLCMDEDEINHYTQWFPGKKKQHSDGRALQEFQNPRRQPRPAAEVV